MQLADGYKSHLGERGQNLSGGQRQRLALARVILKNPPILILDEATSALDTINEARIQEWLNAERGQRTILMVAHRISTLRHSDRIVVFDEGRIVESGPYNELIQRGGLFSELNDHADAASPVASA
jgi:ATP-binding cassette subfamily B protein